MIYLIINSLLYIFVFGKKWLNERRLSPGLVMTGMWMMVAVFGAIYYPTTKEFTGHITLFPLLYLFFAYFIFMRYYIVEKNWDKHILSIISFRSKIIDILCYLYLICVVVNFMADDISLQSIAYSNLIDNASSIYKEAHLGEDRVYESRLIQMTHSYEFYMYYIVLIASFSALCQGRKLFASIFLFVVFVNKLLGAAMDADRTEVVTLIILYVALYALFYKFFNQKIKRFILFMSSMLGAIVIIYLLGITIARFEDSEYGTEGSLLYYLGQPMLYFDYGLTDTMDGCYYGARTFNSLFERFGMASHQTFDANLQLKTHFGSGFVTVIGMLLLDFGYIGTIIFGIFLPWFIMKLTFFKGKLSLPGLYIYLFFFNRMCKGVFVNGSGAAVSYYQAIVFYIIMWIIVHYAGLKKRNLSQMKTIKTR